VAEIRGAGGEALAIDMDVAEEASVIAGYDALEATFGPADTVYANAGMNLEGMALDIPVADFDRVFAVNTRGVFLTAREGARRMIKAGSKQSRRGRVVIMASMGARKVLPGLAAYCGSKAAADHLARGLAREWANQGINVNSVRPGYLETELNADWFHSEAGQKQVAGFPRRRLMTEGDLDALLLFLGSDASAGVTGSAFDIDDGQGL
jgi:NAD(P)-dependent dehydrogenase (short-subunit alcohol dehydrogenase family)